MSLKEGISDEVTNWIFTLLTPLIRS